MPRWSVLVTLVASAASARAGGLVIEGGSTRAIGRAGVGTASDDGGGALLVNPAGLARRDATRVQLGVSAVDDATTWRPDRRDEPIAKDQSASSAIPEIAGELGLGEWVVGVGARTTAIGTRTFASPADLPADQLGGRFEYRYAGISGALRRDTVSIGAARRLGDAVAVGVAVGGSRVALDEARSVWADPVEGRVPDPNHDVIVAMSASGLAPSAIAGVLIAPPDTRIELAASLAWSGAATLTGDAAAIGPSPAMGAPGVTLATSSPSARLELHQPVTARTAARWVGERWIAEVDADLWVFSTAARGSTWALTGIDVSTGNAMTPLARVPSRVSAQTHGALRGAVDVELIAGFLWATAGYAYTGATTATSRLSPSAGDLAGHTAAAGLEISAGGFTIALGWARTWSVARRATSAWQHDNPFGGVTDPPIPTGTYDGSRDLVGIAIDAEM